MALTVISSSRWSRDHCLLEKTDKYGNRIQGKDINAGLEVVLKDLTFPKTIQDAYNNTSEFYQGFRHPSFFTALAAGAYPYTPDKGDVWISAFVKPGDCDSISIAAVQACKSLCKTWVAGICLGEAYLEGEGGRKLTPHAYPIYITEASGNINPEQNKLANDSQRLAVFIDEPTYSKSLTDHSPGTGHIKSCEWILFPGGALKVGASFDGWNTEDFPATKREQLKAEYGKMWTSSKHAPMNSRNKNLEMAIYNTIKGAWPEIKAKYNTTECRLSSKVIEFQNSSDGSLSASELTQKKKVPPLRESKSLESGTSLSKQETPKYSSVSKGVF